jgi:uncharacterized protein YjbJ (UPF0337 family)
LISQGCGDTPESWQPVGGRVRWLLPGYSDMRMHSAKGADMATGDKIDNTAEDVAGKVKEGVGKATDDEKLESEGKTDQAAASVKQAGEKIKDALRD